MKRFKAQGQVFPFSRVCCLQIKDMSQHYLHPVVGRGHISHSVGFQTQPAPGYLAWARTDFVYCVHPVTGPARMRCSSAHLQGRDRTFICLLDTCLNKRLKSSFPVIRRGRWEVEKVTLTNRWLLMACRWRGSRVSLGLLVFGDRVRKKEYPSESTFFFLCLLKTTGDLESGPVPAMGAEVCPVLFFPGSSFPKPIERWG